MKSLQIQYSKEVARELGKIAVYLPGEEIEVGDILTFPYGKKGFLKKTAPLGSFQKITSLKNLGISEVKVQQSKTPDSYRFTSKQAVDLQFGVRVDADLGNDTLPKANGELRIKLSAEGAICFFALHCFKTSLDDIMALENEINTKGKKMVWEDTYLVTSVTIAKKALIIQSNSSSSELTLGGDVQGLQSSSIMKVKTDAKIHIKKQTGDMLIKDWSDEVTVFMDLMKFEKETFATETKNSSFTSKSLDTDIIRLQPVSVSELVENII
ncbi:hypothetical protein [Aquimarina longa]|uniref:hypothetical protein n=1 Tax=Aquimarina longa TaxID=1080221 RepID=UPI0007859764|nr:hypothetical protein [Aquimarina longa]